MKSTEALNYQDLLKANLRKELTPCKGIKRCRNEALPQLGYVDGISVIQTHQLVLRGDSIVPFPADFGMTAAVLVQDGRVDSLRSDERYRTPKKCRESRRPRDCWRCWGSSADPNHVAIATLKNTPGHLPLVPSGEVAADWLAAYQRWAQSIWVKIPSAVNEATVSLANRTEEWLAGDNDRVMLEAFWGSYLRDVAEERGITLRDDAVPFQTLEDVAPQLGWQPASQRHPGIEEASLGQLIQIWHTATEVLELREFVLEEPSEGQAPNRYNIRMSPEGHTLTCLPSEWRPGSHIQDESAEQIAARLVGLAMVLGRGLGDENSHHFPIPIRRISLHLGDSVVHLGWGVNPITVNPQAWRKCPVSSLPWCPLQSDLMDVCPNWLAMLAMGDPRVRLFVLPDGRCRLKMPHIAGAV